MIILKRVFRNTDQNILAFVVWWKSFDVKSNWASFRKLSFAITIWFHCFVHKIEFLKEPVHDNVLKRSEKWKHVQQKIETRETNLCLLFFEVERRSLQ